MRLISTIFLSLIFWGLHAQDSIQPQWRVSPSAGICKIIAFGNYRTYTLLTVYPDTWTDRISTLKKVSSFSIEAGYTPKKAQRIEGTAAILLQNFDFDGVEYRSQGSLQSTLVIKDTTYFKLKMRMTDLALGMNFKFINRKHAECWAGAKLYAGIVPKVYKSSGVIIQSGFRWKLNSLFSFDIAAEMQYLRHGKAYFYSGMEGNGWYDTRLRCQLPKINLGFSLLIV